MPGNEKLRCPCGAEMNRHAEKVDYSAALEDPELMDPALGGALAEFHTCPACGYVEERPAK